MSGGRGFDSRRNSSQPHYGAEVDSNCNRNEYQGSFLGGKGGRCLRLTILASSFIDCQKSLEREPPEGLRESFTFTLRCVATLCR
jgi:hypothetical protein